MACKILKEVSVIEMLVGLESPMLQCRTCLFVFLFFSSFWVEFLGLLWLIFSRGLGLLWLNGLSSHGF